MAFETGTAADIPDLIAKLSTFLQANGWTEDQRDNGARRFAFHKGTIYFSGRWGSDTANIFSLHHALGYTGGNAPGNHPNDSGQGYNASATQTRANLLTERHVDLIGTGPYPNYWFFEKDASPAYIHVVVEVATGTFVHFGAGSLQKFGNWTGGEYVYGHYHPSGNTSEQLSDSCVGLDGFASSTSGTDEDRPATLHVEGLVNQPGSGKWGIVWGRDSNLGVDTAAVARVFIQGGYRAGTAASDFGFFAGSLQTGLVPMSPIPLWHVDGLVTVGSGAQAYYLGYQEDVRMINIRHFSPAQIVPIGGDDWYVFPMSIRDINVVARGSGFMGMAYKKVTA